jgi:transposase InsO family protein
MESLEDTFSRRVVGWSIDSQPAASLVTNALGMAIEQRGPQDGRTLIHSDQGTQFTSWAFTQRAVDSGLLPSMGSVGNCYELANAIFECLEIFHDRRRRHSSLGMVSPVEYELRNAS